MSYSKIVKFDYCRVYYKIKKKHTVYRLFNIEVLLNEISNQGLERKEITVYDGCKVRIEKFDYDEENKLWTLRVLRLRDGNLSFIVRPDEEAKPIELGDDEYLGEDMTMLFDVERDIAMIQRNRFALGIENLKKLMRKIMANDDLRFDIRPITKEVNVATIQKDYFKSIEIRFANLKGKNIDSVGGPLGSIINTYSMLNGGGGSFVVNLGRTRRESLAKEPTRELLDGINENRDLFSDAILRAKNAEDNDIDIINLFDNIYSAFISFELAERTSLSYEECTRKMTERYLFDKPNIVKLL